MEENRADSVPKYDNKGILIYIFSVTFLLVALLVRNLYGLKIDKTQSAKTLNTSE